jgi:hypothetical protein
MLSTATMTQNMDKTPEDYYNYLKKNGYIKQEKDLIAFYSAPKVLNKAIITTTAI